MRIFENLTQPEQHKAIRTSLAWIIEGIVFGLVEVKLINPRNHDRLEHILLDGRKRDETRLTILRIMNNKPICDELRKLALVDASECKYDAVGCRILEERLH